MAGYFVTGSGTGVGKTYVTAARCRQLQAAGRSVRALKPVISGWDPALVEQSDTGVLLAAQGLDITKASIDAISPWRYAEPLSPDMAAARENRAIDYNGLLGMCRQAIEKEGQRGTLFIEGVGGVMVPLTEGKTVLNWMADLGLPALLVTGSYLGSLSHTLTAALALQSRNIPLHAIIVSETEDSAVPLDETAAALSQHLADARIVTLEWEGDLPEDLLYTNPGGPS